jgi:glutamate synthase (NADPH/NADH) small chain
MGKVTGFKEFKRQDEKYTSVKNRIKKLQRIYHSYF